MITVTVLFGLFAFGSALDCFECNSYTDAACGDEFNENSTALLTSFKITCAEEYNGQKVKPFCRKTIMDVYVANSVRIQRDCGYQMRESTGYDCYQKRSEDYVVNVCQCEDDLCNGANGLVFAPVLAVLVPLFARFL